MRTNKAIKSSLTTTPFLTSSSIHSYVLIFSSTSVLPMMPAVYPAKLLKSKTLSLTYSQVESSHHRPHSSEKRNTKRSRGFLVNTISLYFHHIPCKQKVVHHFIHLYSTKIYIFFSEQTEKSPFLETKLLPMKKLLFTIIISSSYLADGTAADGKCFEKTKSNSSSDYTSTNFYKEKIGMHSLIWKMSYAYNSF